MSSVNLGLGLMGRFGQVFGARTIPEIFFVSISFDKRGEEGLSVNRHKSFRRSVATLGCRQEQLHFVFLSQKYDEEEVQFSSAR